MLFGRAMVKIDSNDSDNVPDTDSNDSDNIPDAEN